ncbi:hypothetical protein C0J52_28115 [Blattella germanica]|nr:hypothetical protein C0J52_28115 [Blattella germanica]
MTGINEKSHRSSKYNFLEMMFGKTKRTPKIRQKCWNGSSCLSQRFCSYREVAVLQRCHIGPQDRPRPGAYFTKVQMSALLSL